MARQVHTLRRNDKLSIADDLMKQERVRHIPIFDEWDQLCGVLTQRDLFRGALIQALGFGGRAEEHMLETLVVKEVMSTRLITTTADTPVAEAARTMFEKKVGCLPVLEKDKLVGLITEGDFVRLTADGKLVAAT